MGSRANVLPFAVSGNIPLYMAFPAHGRSRQVNRSPTITPSGPSLMQLRGLANVTGVFAQALLHFRQFCLRGHRGPGEQGLSRR
jgi:hypothetical protein